MAEFVKKHHYSQVMPRLTKVCYGGFKSGTLVAAVSFGWGSRPKHTIKKLFPTLDTKDYLEIGKMCLTDEEPKNTESYFLAIVIRLVKKKFPIKLVFTWADGMWGKPGYVYQASNFQYGGFIWTDVYIDSNGSRFHPLQLQSERRKRGLSTELRTQRPKQEEMDERGWTRYFGKQFRYIRFVCSNKEKQELINSSLFNWNSVYPKHKDLQWKKQIAKGKHTFCEQPNIKQSWSK
jgi:hypothetical protein